MPKRPQATKAANSPAGYCGVTDTEANTPQFRGERHWPVVLAVVATMGMHQLLPADFRLSPDWIVPTLLTVCIVLLVLGDPGVIDRQRTWLRVVTGVMIGAIALGNVVSAVRLIDGMINRDTFEASAYQLLGIGAIVWLTNNIAFSLWYWDVDGGGAARRAARGAWADPAFVFPEMSLPDHVSRGWYPQYADYLALGFNTGMAFSPTDVSAVKRWAKVLLLLQSLASIALATLVLAKAINGL